MDNITKNTIKKLARRAGIRDLHQDSYNTIRDLTAIKLAEVVNAIIIVNNEHKTSTITVNDTYKALEILGYNIGKI